MPLCYYFLVHGDVHAYVRMSKSIPAASGSKEIQWFLGFFFFFNLYFVKGNPPWQFFQIKRRVTRPGRSHAGSSLGGAGDVPSIGKRYGT